MKVSYITSKGYIKKCSGDSADMLFSESFFFVYLWLRKSTQKYVCAPALKEDKAYTKFSFKIMCFS